MIKSKCMSSDCADGNPILSAVTDEELQAKEYFHYALSKKEGAFCHSCRDFRSDEGTGRKVRGFNSQGMMSVRIEDEHGNVRTEETIDIRMISFYWAHPEAQETSIRRKR